MKEYHYNDGLRNGSREPRLYFARGEEFVKFQAAMIPGFCLVVTSKFQKNGKWSNTDYSLLLPDDVTPVFMLSPLHGRFGQEFKSWADAATQMCITLAAARAILAVEYPTTAQRLNEIENFK